MSQRLTREQYERIAQRWMDGPEAQLLTFSGPAWWMGDTEPHLELGVVECVLLVDRLVDAVLEELDQSDG